MREKAKCAPCFFSSLITYHLSLFVNHYSRPRAFTTKAARRAASFEDRVVGRDELAETRHEVRVARRGVGVLDLKAVDALGVIDLRFEESAARRGVRLHLRARAKRRDGSRKLALARGEERLRV